MKNDLALFAKGFAMGAANVIPGVSGGTIALITGIYQRLIAALGSVDASTVSSLLRGDIKTFWQKIDGRWLTVLLSGVAISIVTLAHVFEWLLEHHERLTMAFFFGLIVLSIVQVGRRVSRWHAGTVFALLLGIAVAVGIATLAPASPNAAPLYVFLCGMLAISSMILPGLSGSFVLILLGNYALVLNAINTLDFGILLPLAAGCAIGLLAFSHFLNWVFNRHEDLTLAVMTGFVIGSLSIIWPWKHVLTDTLQLADGGSKEVIVAYEWFLPSFAATETWLAIGFMVLGGACIALMERLASR